MRLSAISLLIGAAVGSAAAYWHYYDPPPTPGDDNSAWQFAAPANATQTSQLPNDAASVGANLIDSTRFSATVVEPSMLMDRGNVLARRCDECPSGIRVDNPYEDVPLEALKRLAVQDPTAAFQVAARLEQLSEKTEGVDQDELQRAADDYALRSIALSSSEDFRWYYAGVIEHLNVYQRSDWSSVSDERLSRTYKWLQAASAVEVLDADETVAARVELLARGLDLASAEQAAEEHAAELRRLRMTLTGLDVMQ